MTQLFLNWGIGHGYAPRTPLRLPHSYQDIKSVIEGHAESHRPLVLPETIDELPEKTRSHILELSQKMPTEEIESYFKAGKIGIGEETGDILFFLFLNTALKKSSINSQKLNAFKSTHSSLMDTPDAERYARLKSFAEAEISQFDIDAISPYFPDSIHGSGNKNEVIKDFLTLFFLSYITYNCRFPGKPCLDLSADDFCINGLQGESQELSKKTKIEYKQNWLDLDRQVKHVQELCRSSSYYIDHGANFDFLDFARFEVDKCLDRVKLFYLNPLEGDDCYPKLKAKIKGKEKIDELYTFFL